MISACSLGSRHQQMNVELVLTATCIWENNDSTPAFEPKELERRLSCCSPELPELAKRGLATAAQVTNCINLKTRILPHGVCQGLLAGKPSDR